MGLYCDVWLPCKLVDNKIMDHSVDINNVLLLHHSHLLRTL